METKQLEELFNSLTLSEKLGQMTQVAPMIYGMAGSITGPLSELGLSYEDSWKMGTILGGSGAVETKRIQGDYLKHSDKKIPLVFMSDIIHGFKTIFPVPIALGCSFDPTIAGKVARISAVEGSVAGVHVTFSPMTDLVRDPRWGRVVESTGEDPYLNSLFAENFVIGYQKEGEDKLGYHTVASCVKHFAAYGAPEGGRDYNTVDISPLMLRQFYLPSYMACIKAGCELVMTAFNIVEGVPCTANKKLIKEILRGEWNFDGVVISDWGAVKELIHHGFAKDNSEAAYLAAKAGLNIEMMTSTFYKDLEEIISDYPDVMEDIDKSVWQILQLKNKLKLFENPYRFADEDKEKELIMCDEHRNAAREIATKSMVLLTNDGTLPLQDNIKISLIGPFADSNDLLGPWSLHGVREDAVTLKEGLISQGYKLVSPEESDVIIACLGEESKASGEGGSMSDITISKDQVELLKEYQKFDKPIVTILHNGRPLVLNDILPYSNAILETWFLGTESGNAITDVLSGKVNPSGKLSMSFPYSTGQIPIYYNHFNTGRPLNPLNPMERYKTHYLDIPNEPLFPFGYGLSYTTFELSPIRLSEKLMTTNTITASIDVKNIGAVKGVETVQFYLQDPYAQVVRPVKQLIHFEQVTLEPNEERTLFFELTKEMLMYYNADLEPVLDAGKFILMAGDNSRDVKSIEFFLKL